jgi:hypothetical protein
MSRQSMISRQHNRRRCVKDAIHFSNKLPYDFVACTGLSQLAT